MQEDEIKKIIKKAEKEGWTRLDLSSKYFPVLPKMIGNLITQL